MIDISKYEGLKDALAKDEQALWVGRPQAYKLMEGVMKSRLLLRWVLCGVLAAALMLAYGLAFGGKDTFQPFILVVIVLVFGFFVLRPLMDRKALCKKTLYCISDRRVLMLFGSSDVFELSRKGLKYSVAEAGDGMIHILLGSCSAIPEAKFRVRALSPKRGAEDVVTGFVMYKLDKSAGEFFSA